MNSLLMLLKNGNINYHQLPTLCFEWLNGCHLGFCSEELCYFIKTKISDCLFFESFQQEVLMRINRSETGRCYWKIWETIQD